MYVRFPLFGGSTASRRSTFSPSYRVETCRHYNLINQRPESAVRAMAYARPRTGAVSDLAAEGEETDPYPSGWYLRRQFRTEEAASPTARSGFRRIGNELARRLLGSHDQSRDRDPGGLIQLLAAARTPSACRPPGLARLPIWTGAAAAPAAAPLLSFGAPMEREAVERSAASRPRR